MSAAKPLVAVAMSGGLDSSVTAWLEAAMSISRWVMGVSGLRAGPSKSEANLSLVMRSPAQ